MINKLDRNLDTLNGYSDNTAREIPEIDEETVNLRFTYAIVAIGVLGLLVLFCLTMLTCRLCETHCTKAWCFKYKLWQ